MTSSGERILFFLKGYPRVSETFIAQEIYLLQERGFKIDIVSMRAPREAFRQPINEKIKSKVFYTPEYVLPAFFELAWNNVLTAFSKPSTYFPTLVSCLVKSLRTRNRSPFKRFIQASWVIQNCHLPEAYSHLHSHFIHAPTELVAIVARITGLRYSISAHAKDIYTIPKSDVIERVNSSEFITTCTSFNYSFLNALDILHKDKIKLNYHGVDTDNFAPSDKPAIGSAQTLRLVSVGRLVEKKGYDVIFAALSMLKNKGFDFHYDLYGAGELEDQLRQMALKLGIESRVTFHLTKTHKEIITRFQEKGIFLCGSKITDNGDRDGIPNTVAEAMSMELPVIATKVSGIPELVEHLKSGYLIDSNHPEQMAEAILYLFNNPDIANRIGKSARVRVESFFDSHACIGDIEGLFRKVLS